ncbi:unnamed protein product [Calypogeia fissa]
MLGWSRISGDFRLYGDLVFLSHVALGVFVRFAWRLSSSPTLFLLFINPLTVSPEVCILGYCGIDGRRNVPPDAHCSLARISSLVVSSASCIGFVRKGRVYLEVMTKTRAMGLFSRLDSQHRNGADRMKFSGMVRFGPHSATRVHPPSSGLIGFGTSRSLGTATSGTVKCWQLTMGRLSWCCNIYSYEKTKDIGYSQVKLSDITKANFPDQRSDRELWFRQRKPRANEFNHIMTSNMNTAGTTREAVSVLKSRLLRDLNVDPHIYVDVLRSCWKHNDLLAAKHVHEFIIESGMGNNLYVATALINVYIKCGELLDARRVFDELENKDVLTWNMMISGYAKSKQGCGHEAYQLFLQMRREGFQPDAITYLSILNASASAGALQWVKEVHGHVTIARLESDVRVGSALVHMYAKSGSIADARLVFDRMETRNVYTWTTMIGALAENGCGHEAYRLFLKMKQEGFQPNAITYTSILNASASSGALEWVKEVHGHATEAGLESDVRVGSALVHMYAESGSLDDARLVFDRMEKRDVATWNVMIGGLAKHGYGHQAYRLFLLMREEGFKPDVITYTSILNASASAEDLEWVKELHGHATIAGLDLDVRVGNALVHMYAKSGSIESARQVFDRMEERDVYTWTIMIGGLAEHGCGLEAYRLFLKMRHEGLEPNAITYTSILNASASAGALDWVRVVHDHATKAALDCDVHVANVLVHMYSESGSLDDARLVFDRMEKRDLVTWNVIIGALAKYGCGLEAYGLFLQMRQEGFEPNAITYTSILNASASAGALEWVKEVHGHACKAGLELDVRVGNALVHMYAKSGSINDARLIFDRMEKSDVVTWTIMIGGLAEHGCGHEALELFTKMNAYGVKPNETSFVAVLSACCHAGLLDDGRSLFLAMKQEYGIQPTIVHYTCMVDLLGRAGHLDEAKLFIRDMPVEPDVVTWGAFLGACRTYGNVELGELAAQELLKLEPNDASAYVLLSNIYAAAGKWEKVASVRTMMQEQGVRKEPGRSWIEVDNKIHEFVVGDISHPEAKAIYTYINKLTKELEAEGYIPDTKVVLQNVDEVDKELAVCSHSERLAIAYGLMHIPCGKPIRVQKNLRVCSDCHTATKFISKVTRREIIARDVNRFHHFKDGLCSCGDYW